MNGHCLSVLQIHECTCPEGQGALQRGYTILFQSPDRDNTADMEVQFLSEKVHYKVHILIGGPSHQSTEQESEKNDRR